MIKGVLLQYFLIAKATDTCSKGLGLIMAREFSSLCSIHLRPTRERMTPPSNDASEEQEHLDLDLYGCATSLLTVQQTQWS